MIKIEIEQQCTEKEIKDLIFDKLHKLVELMANTVILKHTLYGQVDSFSFFCIF